MICPLLLAAMLSAGPDVDALRRELDDVASRIEALKARRRAGEPIEDGSLERLLVRSQELAEELEGARPRPAAVPPGPDPRCELADELREQAAALREEAAQLMAEAAQVKAELARSVREEPPSSRPATFTSDLQQTVLDPATRVAALAERRAALEAQARALEAQASILDAAADALERSGTTP
ncbi:MAG TPA: hypothetical protein VEB43_14485 [Anaeromyxobacter sp.]|nr:hypothetical protein [Anaeromyxobacter sp.]